MQETAPPVSFSIRDVLRWATESLRSLYGNRLQHLILFGSHARGEALPESDVDLLVVLEGPVQSLEESRRTSPIALRAAAHHGTVLSFVHLSIEDFEDERRPLVRRARKEGVNLLEAPTPDSSALSQSSSEPPTRSHEDAVRALLQKAKQALADAEMLVENGSVEAAINRAYYAVFSAARAALLSKDETPNTHTGVIRRFAYHFVRTEEVGEKIGEILTTAESMRGQADYEIFSDFEQEEATELTSDANRFVESVEEKLLSER